MSRPSATWLLLWVVLIALCITIWQALKVPEDSTDMEVAVDNSDLGQQENRNEMGIPAGDGASDSLLGSLPAPQSPPASSDAAARKQWLDELMGLIDEAAYLDDQASLRMLIVEFRNPEDEIAQSAHSSLMARKDRKALPYLKEMSALELAPATRMQLEEIIEFLNSKSVFDQERSRNP